MKFHLIAAATLMAASVSAQAASINAASATFAGTVIDFNNFDGLETSGPLDLGFGVTMTSTPVVEVGASERALGTNGTWTVLGDGVNRGQNTEIADRFVATEFINGRGEFGFTFAAPVSQVGAFVNQFQVEGVPNTIQVLAYDQFFNVLESFTVSIDTDEFGYDEGRFIGFERATADIYGFGFANGSFVVDNLTIGAVPEASTWAMLVAGLGLMGTMARRRRSV